MSESEGETNPGFRSSTEEIPPPPTPPPQSAAVSNGIVQKSEAQTQTTGPAGRTVVHVADACKSYGRGKGARQILKSLSMAVEEHTIYGLLGASGCGKTTILSCIVGLRSLDSGSILVCGHPTGSAASGIPGRRVGYMPQEIALNGECTIAEVLLYFGRIYGMSRSQIRGRHEYLIDLLSLQGLDQSIENLSQGQQRRVSMAVALLHEPELLILDEPTVGCDPLLRESIWAYLHQLVAKKETTVIVTTHYIEEMRQADRIGIMRSGHLLCEDTPGNLLQIYNEELLDTVVVKLCQQDAGKKGGPRDSNAFAGGEGQDGFRLRSGTSSVREELQDVAVANGAPAGGAGSHREEAEAVALEWRASRARARAQGKGAAAKSSTTNPINRLHALIVKNLLVTWRNIFFTVCLLCVPALSVSVFCVAVGSDPSDLRIGVVNEEMDCFANFTPSTGGGEGEAGGGCLGAEALSCAYLQALDSSVIKLVAVETLDEAVKQVSRAKLWGYLHFSADFSTHFHKRVAQGDVSDNETLSGSQINVRLDNTGATNGLILQKNFIEAFQKVTAQLCGVEASSGAGIPVAIGAPILGRADAELTEYMGPGVGLGFIFFMCAMQCGLTYIIEKKDGMLARTLVGGVSTIEIMVSHFIVQLCLVAFLQIIVTFLILYVLFEIPLLGSLWTAFALNVVMSMAAMSLGFLLATFCDDEKYAMLIAMALVFPNFLIAGLIWPIEGLPVVLQKISPLLPCTLTGEAFRSISLRGFGLDHPKVWGGFLSAGAWMAVYWSIILAWHRWGQRKK